MDERVDSSAGIIGHNTTLIVRKPFSNDDSLRWINFCHGTIRIVAASGID